jgi:hypothetical protein
LAALGAVAQLAVGDDREDGIARVEAAESRGDSARAVLAEVDTDIYIFKSRDGGAKIFSRAEALCARGLNAGVESPAY